MSYLSKKITSTHSYSLVRGVHQEFTARYRHFGYTQKAKKMGARNLNSSELKAELRKRLSSRRIKRPAKSKGDMHIFLASKMGNWETILPVSLKSFGRVTVYDWTQKGFDHLSPNWLTCRQQMYDDMLGEFKKANQIQPVDAVVGYLSGNTCSPATLREMANEGATIFNFCLDDKLQFPGKKYGGRYRSPAGIAEAVDLNLTSAPDSTIKYVCHGGLAYFWPEAACPEIHKPYNLPYKYDVSFIGARYGWRPRFIEKLHKKGINVVCFGNGWDNGPLTKEGMIKLYSESRINLGFSGIGHSRRLMCLKGRDFEVPMSGGLYLTQSNPELSLVFKSGEEILTYEGHEDCAKTIKNILSNPKKAELIRNAGRERCLKDHTYQARWEDIFKLAGLLKP